MRRHFEEVEEEHMLTSYVMPVIGLRAGHPDRASGSAVMIGPRLALTALHVLDDYVQTLDGVEFIHGENRLQAFSIEMHQRVNGKVIRWNADKMASARPFDIALLQLVPAENTVEEPLSLYPPWRLTPPRVGDWVCGVGYPRADVVDSDSTRLWRYGAAKSVGQVSDVFPERRDNGFLSFPAFQTDAFFDGGMSGGAVFNEALELCGIICSSLDSTSDDEPHIGSASLLWPALNFDHFTDS